jgi:hypothetical protein
MRAAGRGKTAEHQALPVTVIHQSVLGGHPEHGPQARGVHRPRGHQCPGPSRPADRSFSPPAATAPEDQPQPRSRRIAERHWRAASIAQSDIGFAQHRARPATHSITSSARSSIPGGTVRPSSIAILRLMTSSNVVGCWTGRSAAQSIARIALSVCIRGDRGSSSSRLFRRQGSAARSVPASIDRAVGSS